DFSKITIGLYLLGYGPRFFHCAFFWGIIPASMALFTPALTHTFPDPEYVNFYYGHGLILLGIGIALFALNERPYFKDFLFVVGITLLFTLLIYIINLMLGADANFWYLRDKPQGDTIMNWFPDAPLHITVLIPAAIFAFFLTYLPFLIKDHYRGS
ncbi:MAG: TIGR02206 family membrane protein, partial [Gammaproteobacteria bacterium]|nr:TIGR02206 family membrane protein [Gammaproteobacteria bacterium]